MITQVTRTDFLGLDMAAAKGQVIQMPMTRIQCLEIHSGQVFLLLNVRLT